MSVLTDILDRLSAIAALRDRVSDLTVQLADLRAVMFDQKKSLAELRGQMKALIHMQSQSDRR
jgi:hypothetical protein